MTDVQGQEKLQQKRSVSIKVSYEPQRYFVCFVSLNMPWTSGPVLKYLLAAAEHAASQWGNFG